MTHMPFLNGDAELFRSQSDNLLKIVGPWEGMSPFIMRKHA